MNQKVIDMLAQAVNVSASELASAIGSEESTIEINTPHKVFSEEEWGKFNTSVDKEKEGEYHRGKEVGVRQWVRDSKESEGMEYEGKDPEIFMTKYKEKILNDADKNPDERVKSLSKDLDILRKENENQLNQAGKYKAQLEEFKNSSIIKGYMPNKPKDLTTDDAYYLLSKGLKFEKDEDGNEAVFKDGELLKDTNRSPISWEKGVKDFWLERNWNENPDGRDKKKKSTVSVGSFTKMSEVDEYLESNSINPKSHEARVILNDAAKAEGFDMNT